MSAIESDYRTFKHIPSRKCYQLIMEVAEEDFGHVCEVLGYPKTGENTYVGIALLDKSIIRNVAGRRDILIHQSNQTEGERLRTRAIMLCRDGQFQQYICEGVLTEEDAASRIKAHCDIKSRSELATNIEAQNKFKIMLEDYKTWQLMQHYEHA